MNIQEYLQSVNKRYKTGHAREHAYRHDLESLVRHICPHIEVTNEPKSVTECGNPDFVISSHDIPIGFIEAKDIDKNLNSSQFSEQFNRYKKSLDNLIITNNIWFQFYLHGELITEVHIGEIRDQAIVPLRNNFAEFEQLIQKFCGFQGQTIKSHRKLAVMMAGKARLLQSIIEYAVNSDEENDENSALFDQYSSFKNILIHDLSPRDFADIYAQTLAYGMFAARLHDPTLETFSRKEAAELIPHSNPFLRKLFQHVAGYDIDRRIKTTVDVLAEVFRCTNVNELIDSFNVLSHPQDPIIHFYETFLTEYDADLRTDRGVWYTPAPIVRFIVKTVDEILKDKFNISEGLADYSKTKAAVEVAVLKGRGIKRGTRIEKVEKEFHKVQILDPV